MPIKTTSYPGVTCLERILERFFFFFKQKTAYEIALNILIAGLTLIFLLAVATLPPYAKYAIQAVGSGSAPTVAVLVSLLVCLIPTTIGGFFFSVGFFGVDCVIEHNLLGLRGKAREGSRD